MKQKRLLLLMALFPAMMAWAAVGDEFAADGLKYKVTSESPKTVELTRFDSERPTGALTIPTTVNGYTVTSIGTYAFNACQGMTSVEIPNSVTSIGQNVFRYCFGLTSVNIGNGVTSIGDYAFAVCIHLKAVTIPSCVTSIGNGAFVGCNALTSISIPKNVTSLGEGVFSSCENLKTVYIAEGVTSSLDETFFSKCANLESITVAAGNEHYKSVDGVLFSKDMTALVKYPSNNKLTSYTIPSSVTTVCGSAFDVCKVLKAVTIPASVTNIAHHAFTVCTALESFTVAAGNKYYKSVDGVLFDKGMTTLIMYPENKKLKSYTIPSGVTTIKGAFIRCPGLTSVTIPASVTRIEDLAFASCADLTTVSIAKGSKLKSVGRDPFFHCEKLAPVTFPPGVEEVR